MFSGRPEDISCLWWCLSMPILPFACDSFWKYLSRTRLTSWLLEIIFRTPQTRSNATLLSQIIPVSLAFMPSFFKIQLCDFSILAENSIRPRRSCFNTDSTKINRLLAPFASKLVNYSRHSENSEIDDIFLQRQLIVDFQTYFKDSLCFE